MAMPRIVDPKNYRKGEIARDIKKMEKEVAKEKEEKASGDNPTLKKKKEPKWALWYVIIAILVFGLGLLTICTINFLITGVFGF